MKVVVLEFHLHRDDELHDYRVLEDYVGAFQMNAMPGVCRSGSCFGHAQPCSILTTWFQSGRCEALQSIFIIGQGMLHGEVRRGE
jgi:undecaprenyl pyrophosphate phosphatase UppP